MVARPDGRAGGRGSARPRGGPKAPKGAHDGPPLQPQPLTDEERDARRKADRDRIEQAARELLTSDGWQRWIRVRASNALSRYSFGNQMLIAIEATSVGSPRATSPASAPSSTSIAASAKARRRSASSRPSSSTSATSATSTPARRRSSSAPCPSSTRYLVIGAV